MEAVSAAICSRLGLQSGVKRGGHVMYLMSTGNELSRWFLRLEGGVLCLMLGDREFDKWDLDAPGSLEVAVGECVRVLCRAICCVRGRCSVGEGECDLFWVLNAVSWSRPLRFGQCKVCDFGDVIESVVFTIGGDDYRLRWLEDGGLELSQFCGWRVVLGRVEMVDYILAIGGV